MNEASGLRAFLYHPFAISLVIALAVVAIAYDGYVFGQWLHTAVH